MDVQLVNHTDGIPTVDLNAELFNDVPGGLYINGVIGRKASQIEYTPLIKTGRVNLCEFFENPDKEQFLKVLLGSLEKYGHMMFNCPVTKGKYYLKDFQMDGSTIPSFTPTGDYRVEFLVTRKEKYAHVNFFKVSWYATITLGWNGLY